MGSISNYYKIVKPQYKEVEVNDNNNGGRGIFGSYSWYNQMTKTSANRLNRYRHYDAMDSDVDVSRALDIIAEEMTGNNPKTHMPLEIKYDTNIDRYLEGKIASTILSALRTWCKIQKLETRLFDIARNTIKYGDTFFIRSDKNITPHKFVPSRYVVGAIVNDKDQTEIKGWMIQNDFNSVEQGSSNFSIGGGNRTSSAAVRYKPEEVIHFSLSSDFNEEAPFGVSILSNVYKTFKQKELLEDALLIYRIQRAPERRVFYIDTSGVPPQKVATHLEQIKNEVHQKKIPVVRNGSEQIESIYNPSSMQEDYFFSMGKNGTGSRVETLPGGQGLGELEDLNYFFQKLWRGLRIPQSYMDTNGEGVFNDGRVGIAYMQEIKFSLYIERLQTSIEEVLDREFKKFLRDLGINVDHSLFRVRLPEPSNYSKSRDQLRDSDLLNNYQSIKDDNTISPRFAKMRYLQWDAEDLALNERMLREEKGLNVDGGKKDLPQIYNPEEAEAGGFEGGLGGSSMLGGGGGGGGQSSLGGGGDDMDLSPDTEGGEENANQGGEGGDENTTPPPTNNQ